MKPLAKLNQFFGRFPLHLAVILMCVLWLIPTLGLFVTSFRSREAVRTTGWWHVFCRSLRALGSRNTPSTAPPATGRTARSSRRPIFPARRW